MRCWCGYRSAVRCRLFAYGPADATASQDSIISHFNPDWFYLSDTVLPRLSWKRGREMDVVVVKVKCSPYSITERRVPELIPVLSSQPAGDVNHKPENPTVGCHYFPSGLQLPPQPLRGLLPIFLLGEQRHNGCKQFA